MRLADGHGGELVLVECGGGAGVGVGARAGVCLPSRPRNQLPQTWHEHGGTPDGYLWGSLRLVASSRWVYVGSGLASARQRQFIARFDDQLATRWS